MDRSQQLVTSIQAVADAIGAPCVKIKAAPGTGDMLTTAITIHKGIRSLVMSFAFAVATTVKVMKNGTAMLLFEGGAVTASALYSGIEVPVEVGDEINFQLGTANDGANTIQFKVEAAR